jgi:DNA-3-methyladenine glycosylase
LSYMGKILSKEFFNRKTALVARELLGKYLVRKIGNKIIRKMITETEAYVGPHDLASHSSKGRTARTEVMFREAGTIYVYLVYGMHEMLNIVTEGKDYPAAVLIRGVDGARGPGIVTKKFKIDRKLNGQKLSRKFGLWIEDFKPRRKVGEPTRSSALKILRLPRIGISYAGPIWSKKKLRFVLKS